MRRPTLVLAVLAILVGCDSDTPRVPTGPSPTPPAPAQVTELSISGDGRFTGLNQVRQFMATARMSDATVNDVTAEATWSSSNPGVAAVTGRGEVTAVGLGLATITALFGREASHDVSVALGDQSRIAGLYRLVLTAAPVCAGLPDWARRREYDATIDQVGAEQPGVAGALTLTVQLQPGFAPPFGGSIEGSSVRFSFPSAVSGCFYCYYDYSSNAFSHEIDSSRQYTLEGDANGTKGASQRLQIAGLLLGNISAVNPATGATVATCSSANHQFTLVHQ